MKPFPYAIFRAYDIRGKVSVLTPEIVCAIAQALAEQFIATQVKRIVIGYDARLSSPSYAQIIQQVCTDVGIDAVLMGCCSSPMLYFAARQCQGNGIMVTASHNAKCDNGIKWLLQGEPATPEMIQNIAQRAEVFYQQNGQCDLIQLNHIHQLPALFSTDYQMALQHDIHLKQKFKIVLDAMHGSAGRYAVSVLQALGCEVIALRCEPNGHFPDHAPDPSQEKHLGQLQAAILRHQAHVGIALDGDGDRLVLLDEQANIIRADRLMALFAAMTLKEKPQHEVVFDVKCSSLVRQRIEQHQGVPVMIRTGSSFLRRYLAQSQGRAIFGGEYAGHYVFNDGRGLGYDDGLYAALRVLEYLAELNQPLSHLMQDYPATYGTEDLYLSTHELDAQVVLAHVRQQSQQFSAKLSEIDGIRLDFEDGFGIIRASNTGEFFTLRFDARSEDRLQEIRQLFIAMLAPYPALARDLEQA